MIERTMPVSPRLRAGLPSRPGSAPLRNWTVERAPGLRSLGRERQRREQVWAWLSLVVLIICWDASARLGERVSPPRARLTHAVDEEELFRPVGGLTVDL